jgi:hypothetical protein
MLVADLPLYHFAQSFEMPSLFGIQYCNFPNSAGVDHQMNKVMDSRGRAEVQR